MAAAAQNSVVAVFNRIARFYDADILQRVVYRPNHDAVVSELRRAGARRVLDVGCGTGILTERIWRDLKPELVCGCDPSPGMLERARARSSQVRWIEGAAEQLPLADGAVDAVVTTEAFQFFDQPAALEEFHRVLSVGGRLVIAAITSPSLIRVPRFLAPAVQATWHTPAGLRALVEDADLEVIDQRRVRPLFGPLWPGVVTVAVRR